MKIKTFDHGYSPDDSDDKINEWLKQNPNIRIINIFKNSLHDLYCYNPGQVCNQWIETTILYEE